MMYEHFTTYTYYLQDIKDIHKQHYNKLRDQFMATYVFILLELIKTIETIHFQVI